MALYAFDGTWNKEDEEAGHKNTNVVRFRDSYTDTEKAFYYIRNWYPGRQGT